MIAPIVVVGTGNVLLRDDGAGVRLAELLAAQLAADPGSFPVRVRVVDGGTLDLDLGRVIDGSRAVLFLDGVDLGRRPGEVVVLRGDEIGAAGARRPGGRAGGIGELVAIARLMGWLRGPVGLVGVQVADIRLDLGLSPRVQTALPVAAEVARLQLFALDAKVMPGGGTSRSDREVPA